MSISDVACRYVLLSIISVLLSPLAFAESGPSLGEPVAPEEIVKWDISIAPDGLNLPPGEGDARLGKEVYRQHCVRCHGDGAEGGDGLADPLVGGAGSLASLLLHQSAPCLARIWALYCFFDCAITSSHGTGCSTPLSPSRPRQPRIRRGWRWCC